MGEIASSSDNKVAVRALMEKIAFPAEKYQLGHTKVFFRAGALAYLEELRDNIVLKLVRWLQGECYGYLKRKVYNIKHDQRELMKVIQRNFRQYQEMREWGWFIIIQKTRPLIGALNMETVLRQLAEKADATYGAYQEQLSTKARLQDENKDLEAEKKSLLKQLEAEQGNLSEYTDRQQRANAAKADLEIKLVEAGQLLIQKEAERQESTLEKRALEQDNVVIKKDIEDLELAIQKLEQEKTNRDHTIRTLNDEIANQDEVINK